MMMGRSSTISAAWFHMPCKSTQGRSRPGRCASGEVENAANATAINTAKSPARFIMCIPLLTALNENATFAVFVANRASESIVAQVPVIDHFRLTVNQLREHQGYTR